MATGFDGGIGFRNQAVPGDIVIDQNSKGMFVYAGNPQLGNLIASFAATNGTDPYGNTYPAAVGTENHGAFTARGDNSQTNYAILAVPNGNNPILLYNHDNTQFSDGFFQSLKDGTSPYRGKLTIQTTSPTGRAANSIEMFSQESDGSQGPVTNVHSDMNVDGIFSAGNVAFGNVTITPSAANTPTSVNVTFNPPLQGTTFTAQVSPNTGVPGTTVTGVGYGNVTSTGMTVTLTRTNTTATTVSYLVIAK